MADGAVIEFGKIDFLFNNVGIIRRNPCEDFLEENWDDVLAIKSTKIRFKEGQVCRPYP